VFLTSVNLGVGAFSRMTRSPSVMPSPIKEIQQQVTKKILHVESDVETNLWRYSPLISSASDDDFYDVFNSERSLIRDRVAKVTKRKRNNRITYSVMNVKRRIRSNASICSRQKKRVKISQDSLFNQSNSSHH